MPCRQVVPLLDTFVDGELPPDKTLDVEQHLTDCTLCVERLRLAEAVRRSVRRVVRAAAPPSDDFRARVAAVLAVESERERQRPRRRSSSVAPPHRPMRWTTILPLSAAAAVTLGAAAWIRNFDDPVAQRADGARPPNPNPVVAAGFDKILDELVDYHARPPAPQITEPSLVERIEPEVGVPVRLPQLNQYGARWEGVSVILVQKQPAGFFRYRLSNHPVTIYVYNASRVPVRAALEARVVHNVPVYVGERHGYSIAAVERRGVGYAVATDLEREESAELIRSLH
jgi:anti-sigma factor RsiW